MILALINVQAIKSDLCNKEVFISPVVFTMENQLL